MAFFDLDKTILAGSSALAFAGPLYRARLITRRDVTRSAYAQFSLATGRVDHAAMERMRARLSVLVAGWDTRVLRRLIDQQLEQIVSPLIYAEATELIRRHRAAGDQVVIVTSTGIEMAEPIGALLEADAVLATRMTEQDGHYTGDIDDYMYGPRKAEAMAVWAEAAGCALRDCSAYSDSSTDLPMLAAVGQPHAVNPDRALRQLADERGWPIHDFTQAPILRRRRRTRVAFTAATTAVLLGWGMPRLVRRWKRLPVEGRQSLDGAPDQDRLPND